MVRRMGEFEVYQRTKDGMFSATKLLNHWNKVNGSKKVIGHFFELKSTKDLLGEMESDIGITTSPYTKQRGGKTQGTWMHPLLFIDFAMWINPKFKLQVLKFVQDQLITYRHGAGDNYRELCSAAQRLDGCNYESMARALNYVVFNKHDKELRQSATEEQLGELQNIQKHLAFSVNTGLIKSFDHLLEHLRLMWYTRHGCK